MIRADFPLGEDKFGAFPCKVPVPKHGAISIFYLYKLMKPFPFLLYQLKLFAMRFFRTGTYCLGFGA